MIYEPIPGKRCSKCKQIKPASLDYFPPRLRKKKERDHLDSWCKDCHNHSMKERTRLYGALHPAKNPREIAYPTGFKHCAGCNRDLPATSEYFHRRGKNGLVARCKECHVSEYRANKEQHAQEGKRRYYAKRSDRLEYHRQYRQSHKQQLLEAEREYRRKNPERSRAAVLRRVARRKAATGTHNGDDIKRQYQAQKGKCYWCGEKVGNTYHVDHVIPLSRGGSNGPDNIVIACPKCNDSKGAKLPHEWRGNGGKML